MAVFVCKSFNFWYSVRRRQSLNAPDRGESAILNSTLWKCLYHSYTCLSEIQAHSWCNVLQWISAGFTPSTPKNRITEHCSSLVHAFEVAAIFLVLWSRDIFQQAGGPACTAYFSGVSDSISSSVFYRGIANFDNQIGVSFWLCMPNNFMFRTFCGNSFTVWENILTGIDVFVRSQDKRSIRRWLRACSGTRAFVTSCAHSQYATSRTHVESLLV